MAEQTCSESLGARLAQVHDCGEIVIYRGQTFHDASEMSERPGSGFGRSNGNTVGGLWVISSAR